MPCDLGSQFAARTSSMRPSAVRDILRVSCEPEVISLAGGLPAPELFPVEAFREAFDAVLREQPGRALQYSTTEGHPPLREFLADRIDGAGRGAASVAPPVDPDRLLITSGSQQGLDLLGKIMLDPGDAVVVESPTYLGAIQAFDQYQATYLVVPTDDDGMEVDALAVALEARERARLPRPKLIYLVPDFQNPSGRTLAAHRRPRLLEIAARFGIPIVEDDPYSELRFEGQRPPSLRALDSDGLVIRLGTFSKLLAPGLRVGWLVAPTRELARVVVLAKQPSDLHVSTLVQMAVEHVVRDGFLDGHVARIREHYRARRDALAAALDEWLPLDSGRSRPEGGLFLWVDLPEALDTSELLAEALTRLVAFVPGRSFHVDGGGAHSMRLNFSTERPDTLREGARRLGEVVGARLAATSGSAVA